MYKTRSNLVDFHIERWAIERLDRDAGMGRLESAPMKPECLTSKLFTALDEKGLEVGMDTLSLWDITHTKTRRMSINRLAGLLGVRRSEIDTLSENMVFWMLYRGRTRKPERVLHATQAARQATKEIYRKVTQSEKG